MNGVLFSNYFTHLEISKAGGLYKLEKQGYVKKLSEDEACDNTVWTVWFCFFLFLATLIAPLFFVIKVFAIDGGQDSLSELLKVYFMLVLHFAVPAIIVGKSTVEDKESYRSYQKIFNLVKSEAIYRAVIWFICVACLIYIPIHFMQTGAFAWYEPVVWTVGGYFSTVWGIIADHFLWVFVIAGIIAFANSDFIFVWWAR